MWQQEAAQHQQESADKSLARQHADHATDPCDKLRYLCLERGPTGMLEFGRVFRRMDNFGSEVLSFEEFVKGIASSGLNLSDEEIGALFSQFGRDSDGSIDVTEFLIAVRPPMSPTRVRILKEAFHKLDKTGCGEITVADLRKLYSVKMHPRYLNGDDSEEKILKQFLAVFEQDGHVDGNITEEDFMNYYAGISTSIDHDIYFDLMIRKAFSL